MGCCYTLHDIALGRRPVVKTAGHVGNASSLSFAVNSKPYARTNQCCHTGDMVVAPRAATAGGRGSPSARPLDITKLHPRKAALLVVCAPDVYPPTVGESHRHVLHRVVGLIGDIDDVARSIDGPCGLASDALCIEGCRINKTSERPLHCGGVLIPGKVEPWWRHHGRGQGVHRADVLV